MAPKNRLGFSLLTQIHFSQYAEFVFAFFGGLEEIRTPDPHNANVVRSQLRYKPICCGIYRSKIILPQQFSVKAKIIS